MKLKKPISQKTLTRILVLIIIILSLVAGYSRVLYENEHKKYKRLEDMYVRVRSILGRTETQRLIDLSREIDNEVNN